MPVPVKPNTFSASTTIVSAQVNADFDTLYNVFAGNIDSTNVHPTRGIGANFIVSSGSGATGAFKPGAFSMTPDVVGSVPFSIVGLALQTADLVQVSTNTTKSVWVDFAGVLHTVGAPAFGATPAGLVDTTTNQTIAGNKTFSAALAGTSGAFSAGVSGSAYALAGTGATSFNLGGVSNDVQFRPMQVGGGFVFAQAGGSGLAGLSAASIGFNGLAASSNPYLADDGSGSHGINVNVPTGSSFGIRMLVNGATNGIEFNTNGSIEATSNASTMAFVPPVYNASGAALAATTHVVTGSTSVAGAGGATVTLSGAAAFTSGSSYFVCVSSTASSYTAWVSAQTATTFFLNNPGGTTNVINWIAVGA